ncbi:hypothetical protein BSKO_07631 [Bryopsis sp. KO-2023]|nr:hypothetical protein BSKO_07631 [Bryopsis sp. KO-2023]
MAVSGGQCVPRRAFNQSAKFGSPSVRAIVPTGIDFARISRRNVNERLSRKLHARSSAREEVDWTSVAFSDDDTEIDDESLNEICTTALRAMLKEDETAVEAVKNELYEMGAFYSQRENMNGALFVLSLVKLMEHEISQAVDRLEGKEKDAYFKLFALLEDSGWKLKREGEEEEEEEDEDSPPPMGAGMYS